MENFGFRKDMEHKSCSYKDINTYAKQFKHLLPSYYSSSLIITSQFVVIFNILNSSTFGYISGVFQSSGKYPRTTYFVYISFFSPAFSFLLLDLMRHHFFVMTQESEVTVCCNVVLNCNQLYFSSLLSYNIWVPARC